MLDRWPYLNHLPHLTPENGAITSCPTSRYNCIAWAAGIDYQWWWPIPETMYFWPSGVPREVTVDAFIKAYETLGYKLCLDSSLREGIEKLAIFGMELSDGTKVPTHAALQLQSGEWTSKLGNREDMSHKTEDVVSCPTYGKVIIYMSRPRLIGTI
jgi:hypothetical protein